VLGTIRRHLLAAKTGIYTGILSKFLKIGKNTEIYSPFYFTGGRRIRIGSNCRIHHNCFLNANVDEIIIGNGVVIQNGVTIISGQHDYSLRGVPIEKAPPSKGHRPLVIEDEVWISAHAIILPNSHLKKGVLVGAGAVVTSSLATEEYGIYAGNPAKLLKNRFDKG